MDNQMIELKYKLLAMMITDLRNVPLHARTLTELYNQKYNAKVNWHDISDILCDLNNEHIIILDSIDISGLCAYKFN